MEHSRESHCVIYYKFVAYSWICDFSVVHVCAECNQKYFIFKHQANLAFQKHFITKSYFTVK
jgi:hypothetical protein